jgi:hypothetical protein
MPNVAEVVLTVICRGVDILLTTRRQEEGSVYNEVPLLNNVAVVCLC